MPFAGTLQHAFPHFATGPTLVRFGGYDLGYAEDRIQIQERPFWHDVKSDASGGAEGPPCDVQFLGAIAIVSCLLNRFKESNMRALSKIHITAQQTDGVLLPTGTYMRQDSKMVDLWLINAAYTLVYQKAFLRQGRQFTIGTRHQAFQLAFECHVTDPCDYELFTYSDEDDPCS